MVELVVHRTSLDMSQPNIFVCVPMIHSWSGDQEIHPHKHMHVKGRRDPKVFLFESSLEENEH